MNPNVRAALSSPGCPGTRRGSHGPSSTHPSANGSHQCGAGMMDTGQERRMLGRNDGCCAGWTQAGDARQVTSQRHCSVLGSCWSWAIAAASAAPALLGKGPLPASKKHVQTAGKLRAFRSDAARERQEGMKIKQGLHSTPGVRIGCQTPRSAECHPTPPALELPQPDKHRKKNLIELSQPLGTTVGVSAAVCKPQPQPQSSDRSCSSPLGAPAAARPRSDGPEASAAARDGFAPRPRQVSQDL